MHIETHPCLGRPHTRASTIVTMGIIRNTFDVHMALQLFLTSLPMARDCYRSGRNVPDADIEQTVLNTR